MNDDTQVLAARAAARHGDVRSGTPPAGAGRYGGAGQQGAAGRSAGDRRYSGDAGYGGTGAPRPPGGDAHNASNGQYGQYGQKSRPVQAGAYGEPGAPSPAGRYGHPGPYGRTGRRAHGLVARPPGDPGGPSLHIRGMWSRWRATGRAVPAALDLRLSPGRRVAVLGGGGAGRSTLTSVLLGLLDYEGSVTLDGIEVRDLPRDRIRRIIGFAGRPPITAFRTAQARLAAARALLAEFPIVLFEEPDAHLDPATAEALLTDLLAAAGNRSVMLMTRRAEFPGADPVFKQVDETVTLS